MMRHTLSGTAGAAPAPQSSASHRGDANGGSAHTGTVVFLFPGQSSVDPGLLVRALRAHPATGPVVEAAHRVLGTRRATEYLALAGTPLRSNRDVQVTVFLATQMYLAGLAAEGIRSAQSAGLSLGEYSHLVDIGALGLDDTLALVDERGRCYDEAPEGIMVTVLAVDHGTVAEVVDRAQAHGVIAISNYNAPTQHVMAGARGAVEWAAAILEDEYGAHTAATDERVPMHSPMMAPVAEAFAPALGRASWRMPTRPYWPNVTGAPLPGATDSDFVSLLTRHVTDPVRWRTSVDALVAAHPDATLLEVGPGRVLHNMLSRAWKGVPAARIDPVDAGDPAAHFRSAIEILRARAR